MNDEKMISHEAAAIQLLMDAGAAQKPFMTGPGNDETIIIKHGYSLEDVSQFFPPKRIKAAADLTDPESFSDYVNRFKDKDTVIFAAVTDRGAQFSALLDYHTAKPVSPRYCSHVAHLRTIETAEWAAWMRANKQQMDQERFAEWLEEHGELIVAPVGADLLELIQTLQAKKTVRFNTAIRLKNGKNSINYDEDVTLRGAGSTSTENASLEIPTIIEAGIAPFEGVAKYKVSARIKYRIAERKIVFWYETINAHLIVRAAVKGMFETVTHKTSLIPFVGSVTPRL